MSVEGIWQGLKVFETQGVSYGHFENDSMRGLKRTVRTLGKPLGHRYGLSSSELLPYLEARVAIYLPTYKWVLENVPEVVDLVERIKAKSMSEDIVLLDYNVNEDFANLKSPLSHAALIKHFIEGTYPDLSLQQLREGDRESTMDNGCLNHSPGVLPLFEE